MTNSLNIYIKWSLEKISGWLREEHNALINHETIYLYIWPNRRLVGQLFQYLHRKVKFIRLAKRQTSWQRFIKNRISIDEHPSVVEDKNRILDWDIDLAIAKGHSGHLVTIVELKTNFTVSMTNQLDQ
jgi:IS30 family transposase